MGNTNSNNNNNNNKIQVDKEKYQKYLEYVKKQRMIEQNKKNNKIKNNTPKIVNVKKDKKISHINIEKKKNFDPNKVENNSIVNEDNSEQINLGINNYHYFKTPVNFNNDVANTFGLDSGNDPRFQNNINKLFENEKNNRNTVSRLHNKELNNVEYDNDNNNVNKPPQFQNYQNDQYNQNNSQFNNVNNYQSQYHNETPNTTNQKPNLILNRNNITLSRDELLKIKNTKNFTKAEKRLLIMNNCSLSQLDPFNLLEISFLNLDGLYDKYISLRNIYHPDKGGDINQFKLAMDALEIMKIVRSGRLIDKNFDELKQGYNEYDKTEKRPMPVDFSMKNKFNISKFNTFFNENKFENQNNNGYGEMMVPSSTEREDIDIEKTINNEKLFNNEFTKYKNNKNKNLDLTIYSVPEPLSSSNNTFEKLGADTTNYTYSSDNISYTDYKDAYESKNIINISDNNIKRTQYKNLEELEEARKNDSLKMSSEQSVAIDKYTDHVEKKEHDRKQRFKEYENKVSNHFHKINKMMINNNF